MPFASRLTASRQCAAEMKGKQRTSGQNLTASLAGFECVVQTQVIKKGDTDAAADGWWGYDTELAPKVADFRVSYVSIRYHKQRIAVPVSAYSALANVSKISIRKRGMLRDPQARYSI